MFTSQRTWNFLTDVFFLFSSEECRLILSVLLSGLDPHTFIWQKVCYSCPISLRKSTILAVFDQKIGIWMKNTLYNTLLSNAACAWCLRPDIQFVCFVFSLIIPSYPLFLLEMDKLFQKTPKPFHHSDSGAIFVLK